MSDDATMEEPPAAVSAPADSIVIRAPQKAERVTEPLSVSDDIQERFQGATVAALGLLPPATVAPGASVRVALAAARAHRGQCVLVVDGERLRGFADMVDLLAAEAQGGSDEAVSTVQQPFAGTPEAPAYPTSFRIFTHATPLAEVAMFFDEHAFALLTDDAGERIVGVVTRGDLERYAEAVGLDVSAGVLGSRSEEESRRDQTLAELLRLLDGSSTLIPDEVSSYYLERAGFRCEDVRLYVYLLAVLTTESACWRSRRKSLLPTLPRTRSSTRASARMRDRDAVHVLGQQAAYVSLRRT